MVVWLRLHWNRLQINNELPQQATQHSLTTTVATVNIIQQKVMIENTCTHTHANKQQPVF